MIKVEAYLNKINIKSNLAKSLIYSHKKRITNRNSDSENLYLTSHQAIKYEFYIPLLYREKSLLQRFNFLLPFLGRTQSRAAVKRLKKTRQVAVYRKKRIYRKSRCLLVYSCDESVRATFNGSVGLQASYG